MKLPEKQMTREEIFKQLDTYKKMDIGWRSGRVLGYIYYAGKAAEEIGKEAYMMFLTENGLDPTVFTSLLKMENDIVSMAAGHVGGDQDVVGNFTSGGTESILLAVKTARDFCRNTKPDIKTPEMILPTTAHAAFHKAAKYFDIKVVQTPVDGDTFRADVAAMESAINPNTILLVGSAPSYAHGVVDPIPEMARLAKERDLLFHTDGCVGAFMLPFIKETGEDVTPFGFDVEGVTSLSMDLHKYAYTPKNASIVLYRNKALRRHQLFACANWTGYSVVNNAIQSSKTGGPLAAAWAVLNFLGTEGYREIAKQTRQATLKLAEGIGQIEELKLLGRPDMFMFSVASDSVNVFHIIEEMRKRNWYIQPQFAFDNSPKNFHISMGMSNVPHIEPLLEDLKTSVADARGKKPSDLVQFVEGALDEIDVNNLTPDDVNELMASVGIGSGGAPDDMSDINEILNSLPVDLREMMIKEFLNDLFTVKPDENR